MLKAPVVESTCVESIWCWKLLRLSTWTSKHLNFWTPEFEHLKLKTSELVSTWTPEHLNFWAPKLLRPELEHLNFRAPKREPELPALERVRQKLYDLVLLIDFVLAVLEIRMSLIHTQCLIAGSLHMQLVRLCVHCRCQWSHCSYSVDAVVPVTHRPSMTLTTKLEVSSGWNNINVETWIRSTKSDTTWTLLTLFFSMVLEGPPAFNPEQMKFLVDVDDRMFCQVDIPPVQVVAQLFAGWRTLYMPLVSSEFFLVGVDDHLISIDVPFVDVDDLLFAS